MKPIRFVTIGLLAAAIAVVVAVLYGFPLRLEGQPRHAAPSAATAKPDVTRSDVTIDPRRQQLIGVRTAPVIRARVSPGIRTVGVVAYDQTRLSEINVKVEGWIRELYVDITGQRVEKGQPLFTLYSPDVLSTESEYLLALKARERLQHSEIEEARTRADQLVASARQRLALWDLPATELDGLENKREPDGTVVFPSPVTGFVIEKQALKGLHVMPGQALYRMADLSVVWVDADVYEADVSSIRIGAPGTVTADSYPADRFSGRAVFVSPTVDEKTRTVKVRFELQNPAERLKPGMYANVDIAGTGAFGLTVPTNALLDSGREQVVFVSEGDGHFAPRHVKAGRRLQDAVQILQGLKEGEQVATSAAFLLDSESQLRASLEPYQSAPNAASTASATGELDVALRTQPDPPKTGENIFEATVKDASGKPIADADVGVQLFMAAMPTMNMPAMRSQVKLQPAGGGVYRGSGEVLSPGRWDVTVTVTRNGQRLGAKPLTLLAR